MNTYQQGFKNEILNSIFNLSGKLWLKVTGAYTMQYLIIIIVAVLSFISLGIFNDIKSLSSMNNPQELLAFYQNLLQSFALTPKFFVFIFLMIVIGGFLTSWFYNFTFLLADVQIKKDRSDFGQIFQESFSKDVFRIFGGALLLYLISIAGLVLVVVSATISGWITFLLFIAYAVFMNKFFLVLPALITGKMNLSNAFSFSFEHMTTNRCFKLFGIMILTFLVLIVVAIVIGLIAGIFSFIPVFGQVIQIVIQILFGGFTAAFTVAALIGLYYRYAPEIDNEKEIDVDNLLVSE